MTLSPFFTRTTGGYAATPMARGPWDERFLHGGPPSALLLYEMTRQVQQERPEHFVVARLTTEFLRPVPLAMLRIEVDAPVGGRTVCRVGARLIAADRAVMAACAVFVRANPELNVERRVRAGHQTPPWPDPSGFTPFTFPFFTSTEAYHCAVDVRLVDAPWGSTPVRCWAKPIVNLIDDSPPSAEEAVVVVADAESGMGPPTDPLMTSYLNPDLTVYFARRPQHGFIGLDIQSHTGDAGVGLSASVLRDADGVFGQSAQSLVLAERARG